jgi:hypothetical protein
MLLVVPRDEHHEDGKRRGPEGGTPDHRRVGGKGREVGGKGRETEAGRVGTQYVPEVFPKTVAARKIFLVAGTRWVPPMGSLLFLPPETQGRNSQNP